MKRMTGILLAVLLIAFALGCTSHIHTIGDGPKYDNAKEARQWYILWGLVPINEVDTNDMAGEATDYEIKTEYNPIDFLIGIPASWITVTSRTVTVTK